MNLKFIKKKEEQPDPQRYSNLRKQRYQRNTGETGYIYAPMIGSSTDIMVMSWVYYVVSILLPCAVENICTNNMLFLDLALATGCWTASEGEGGRGKGPEVTEARDV
jgi:hypothetical protein